MYSFKKFLEGKEFKGHTQDSIRHWSGYGGNMIFRSPQEAKDWIYNRLQRSDSEPSAALFGINGPDYNRAYADAMPIYQSGKSYKIGKRIRQDHRMRLKNLVVKKPDLMELNMIAQANGTEDYRFHPVKWIRINVDSDDIYATSPGERQRIAALAQQIKESGWIEAVVYHYKEGWVIEGQHRIRALKMLGFNTAPGIGIEYFD